MDANNGKDKKGKMKAVQEEQKDGGPKNYFKGSIEMECAMVDILRDQRNLGHKADGGWKPLAYSTAASQLSTQFNMEVRYENVKNHMKLWRKWHAIVSDILGQSGFHWDGSKQMITVDNENVWNEYVQSHSDAKSFRYKVIPNWDGIVDLCAKNRATRHGAETLFDADEVMSNEEDNNNIDIDLGSDTQGMDDLHIGDGSLHSNSNCVQKKRGQSDSYTVTPPIKKNCGSKEGLALVVKKNKQGKKKAAQEEQTDGGPENYFQWSVEMERAMVDILRDQRNLGHKSDGCWKPIAYKTVASQLSTQFHVEVTSQNVKNRMKLWRKWYGIVSDILGQSGFHWDGSKKMITVDNESVWNEYVQSHSDAKSFRYKVMPNWDDIVDLCGNDPVTGHGAETLVDADEVMSNEEDNNSIDIDLGSGTRGMHDLHTGDGSFHSNSNHAQRKRGQSDSYTVTPPIKEKCGSKEGLALAVRKMADFFQEYLHSTKKLDVKEVLDELNEIPDLDRQLRLKALNWLVQIRLNFL